MKYDSLNNYIIDLQSKGRYCFDKQSAIKAIGCSDAAFTQSAHKLARKNSLARVRSGFYINVIPEYRAVGSLPADWFIDELMEYLGLNYYVGLLSAAAYYGSAHQQPQSFQIVTNKQLNDIKIGKVILKYVYKKNLPQSAYKEFKNYTGTIKVASPELLAVDICDYAEKSGYIHNIIQILSDLSDLIDKHKLDNFLHFNKVKTSILQRLGYLFEQIERNALSDTVGKHFNKRKKVNYIPLVPGENTEIILEKNKRWKLNINEQIELDL